MVSDRRLFGERLKRQRERRGIPLEAISENTKIATALFVGLENGDCSRWPAGLYSRAYVRAYAEAIGLSGDDTVEDFVAVFGSKASADGVEDPAPRRRRAAGSLRLSLADPEPHTLVQTARRAVIAGGDLVVAASIALVIHVLLDPGLWLTLGSALAYHAAGRVVSDDPLVWWIYRRARTPHDAEAHTDLPAEHASQSEEVRVGTAASTTA